MTSDAVAAFFERLGHRVLRTESAYWHDARRHFYLSFPYHRLVNPGPDTLYRRFPRFYVGLRFFAPPEGLGRPSYAFICQERSYDLDRLSANTRSKVRRGLKQFKVRRLEPAYVRAHGKVANDDTLRRIRIRDPYPWETYWRAVEQSDCVEVWGALMGDELAAYLVAVIAEGCGEIWVARSSSRLLRFYPNNALLFTALQDMLSRPEIQRVWFGVESLEDVTGTDEFKLSVGFVKSPIRQRVVLHPLLRPAIRNPLVAHAVRALASRPSGNELWRKLNGIMALAT